MTSYFDLTLEEKNAVLEQAAQELGRPARVLEKRPLGLLGVATSLSI
jgi:hypothetical protein